MKSRVKNRRLLAVFLSLLTVTGLHAQEPADFYRKNCFSCHTIGGKRLAGPDLKDVTQRKDRAWLVKFLLDPKTVINAGDPYATQIVKDSNGFVMPTIKGLDRERAEALLNLIEGESKMETSSFAGKQVAERPFATADVERGKQIVLGARSLANGGTACISCHTLRDLSSLGGGRLGPDLTRTYERMGGRRNLTAWLSSPATPTMQSIYKSHTLKQDEILPLVAYLESTSKQGGQASPSAMVHFFLIGLGGSLAGLVILDGFWRKRFNTVRRALVNGPRSKGKRSQA
ncbi:MAG: c-type cytochrome [Bryobacteraceae bacterium]|jgi:mono/diheme cytochrome c family protein